MMVPLGGIIRPLARKFETSPFVVQLALFCVMYIVCALAEPSLFANTLGFLIFFGLSAFVVVISAIGNSDYFQKFK
jgi:hypothetical protein